MNTLQEVLMSYVPPAVVRQIAASANNDANTFEDRFPAAVLFADISGFTKLAERLAEKGSAGAEELTRILNASFGQLIDITVAHGGEITAFAGDAALIVWPARDEPLPQAVIRAIQCGNELIAQLNDQLLDEDWLLFLKITIGAGQAFTTTPGGVRGRREFVIAGDPMRQIGVAADYEEIGEVILSPEAWSQIADRCDGADVGDGFVRLTTIREGVPPHALEPITVSEDAHEELRAYIPSAVRYRLDAGHYDWISELRRVTVIFTKIVGLDYDDPAVATLTQDVVTSLQEVSYRYEASINQLIVDDKGTILLSALGLPPRAHEDDPLRALKVAIDMQDSLRAHGLQSSIGITTGRIFCGARGNHIRREYALMGDTVNLAARLMQHADGDILCDEDTFEDASEEIDLEALTPIQVKGKEAPVQIYRPQPKQTSQRVVKSVRSKLVGRAAEREQIAEMLNGESRLLVVEGEAGIGKSTLMQHVIATADDRYTSMVGSGDAIEHLTPYFGWRPIFARLLDLDLYAQSADEMRQQVLTSLVGRDEVLELAPLLNAVLPLHLPENDLTAHMEGEARANKTNEILLQILEISLGGQDGLLVLEDTHWLDSASWTLLLLAYTELPQLKIALATRPMISPPAELETMLSANGHTRLELTPFDNTDVIELVSQRLGVNELPVQVTTFLDEVAEGHPLFAEEIGYALRDTGLLHIENGTATLVPPNADLRSLDFPSSIEGIITSRVDRLGASQQLTAKVASVIGRIFGVPILDGVYPIEQERHELPDNLQTLDQHDIANLIEQHPELTYEFNHAITQDVIYNLLTFGYRRQLHAAIAQWYEGEYAADIELYYPLLAYHWSHTDDHEKAVEYLEKAAEQAMRNGPFREAIQHYNNALALVEEHDLPVDSFRLATWERQLGVAYHSTGDINESRRHYVKAFAHIERPRPDNQMGLGGAIMGGLLRRAIPFVRRRNFGSLKESVVDLLASRMHPEVSQLEFYQGNQNYMIYDAVANLNIAEALGPSPELATAYMSAGLISGFVPIHSMAETLIDRAITMIGDYNLPATSARIDEYAATYNVGVGKIAKARQMFHDAAAVFEPLGDRHLWSECVLLESMTLTRQGKLNESDALWQKLRAQVVVWGNRQIEEGAILGQAEIAIIQGRLDEALALLDHVEPNLEEFFGAAEKIWLLGMRGRALLRKGDLTAALVAAEQATSVIDAATPSNFYALEGYASAAEVVLAAYEDNPNNDTQKQARDGLKGFAKYTKVMPLGEPRLLIYQGMFERMRGRAKQAHVKWQEGLEKASEFEMPYEQALALIQLAQHTQSGDEQRSTLTRAADLLRDMNALWDLEQVEALLV